jgi:hypothetical protein
MYFSNGLVAFMGWDVSMILERPRVRATYERFRSFSGSISL